MHPTTFELNEFIDGSLSQTDEAAIRGHVDDCAECRMLVTDLRELGRIAASLEPRDPPARTWTQIEGAIRSSGRAAVPADQSRDAVAGPARAGRDRSRESVWGWTLLGAAAVVVLAATVTVRLGNRTPATGSTSTAADEVPTTQSIEAELAQAEEHYQKAIKGLEQIAAAETGALDPSTAATLRQSLAVVDQAIGESRAALRAQPDSSPAQQSLLDSFKAKVSLLQNTVALINELRKGNDGEAAGIVSGLKRGT